MNNKLKHIVDLMSNHQFDEADTTFSDFISSKAKNILNEINGEPIKGFSSGKDVNYFEIIFNELTSWDSGNIDYDNIIKKAKNSIIKINKTNKNINSAYSIMNSSIRPDIVTALNSVVEKLNSRKYKNEFKINEILVDQVLEDLNEIVMMDTNDKLQWNR